MAKEIFSTFYMVEYDTPQEALISVFGFLLKGGISGSYGVYYIWEKDGKYYTEIEGEYHSTSKWMGMGYKTYDFVKIMNYKRTYHDTESETLTGFMFHGGMFFDKDVEYKSSQNTIHL